jgi:hypothetical protein
MTQGRITQLGGPEGRTVPGAWRLSALRSRPVGAIPAGGLLLGYVACLALVVVVSNAETLSLTRWVALTLASAFLLVTATGSLGMAMQVPRSKPAVCPLDAELWRMIHEEIRLRRR